MSSVCASTTVLGEQRERESEEIIVRTHDRGGGGSSTWPLFFSVSSSYTRTCHNFFKTSNGDAYILRGETETKGKRERERGRKKEYRDLFHPSAAFGTL
jgi:hypothetical protein